MLVLLVVLAVAAAGRAAAPDRPRADRRAPLPRRAPLIAAGGDRAGLALAIVRRRQGDSGRRRAGGGATRLATLQSNRYDYWWVALRRSPHEPLRGVGAGGWAVYWLR